MVDKPASECTTKCALDPLDIIAFGMTRKKRQKSPEVPNPAGRTGVPVSLYPLSFDEAVSGLAQTKMPEPECKKPKAKPKKGKG